MIDLDRAAAAADAAVLEGRAFITISPSWLQQVIRELDAARAAQRNEGKVFGLPEGTTI